MRHSMKPVYIELCVYGVTVYVGGWVGVTVCGGGGGMCVGGPRGGGGALFGVAGIILAQY
jgi:hypothetical protein